VIQNSLRSQRNFTVFGYSSQDQINFCSSVILQQTQSRLARLE
jgi:hypothetical protein